METHKTYSSFAQLQGNILQHYDRIIFDYDGFRIEYIVYKYCLYEINDNFHLENEIFELLGLNAWDFCEQHYSELPDGWERDKTDYPNYWPDHCDKDYKSLTKVVLELFRLIEEQKQLAETSETLFVD